ACETLWKSVVTKQLYITGGIGQSQECERFSYAYDLPNESNYSETCASIGLAMWAHRMLQLDADAQYADIIERTLYNGILSGVAASGDKFFYANYMAMYPDQFKHASTVITKPDRLSPERRQWFSCACCPANLTRLIASVGGYMYSSSMDGVYIHLYGDSTTCFPIGDSKITLSQHGNYPWSGDIQIHIDCEKATRFGLALRIPGWCRNYMVKLNGQPVDGVMERGYLNIRRQWNPGDTVSLLMDMPVMKIEANPKVRQDCGRIALQRGPLVYCLEEADNYPDLNDFVLQYNHGIDVENSHLFGGIIILKMSGTVTDRADWDDTLYRDHRSQRIEAQATAIPYYLWANRGMGEMIVWIRAEE
ncbi:MAG TPA: beta-L-arabinofuranosidase domain-containing protein, partial [Clostridia bacterium]